MKVQILLVRDGLENAAPSIARVLREAGMKVRTVSGTELPEAAPADVVLLAIPPQDPVATCWALHRLGYRWVVAASASPSSQECITLLNAGADYYLDAWLSAPELVARVRVVLRFSAWLDESYDHGTLGHQPIPNTAGSRTHQRRGGRADLAIQ
jgi:DNA-binding response OmpR family regulator